MLEEAAKRDHRRLGREMELFHLQEEAPGMVFWHPNGWTVYRALEDYMRRRLTAAGYREIRTPQVVDRVLWEKSGHWEAYRENMFLVEVDEEGAKEKRTNALKPMNCPCHVQIYNHGLKSYRDLPLRLAEFGSCHRYEPSGSMHGLMRVRGFTQDDAHIFCTEDQIEEECAGFLGLLSSVYADLGFKKFDIKLSTRPEVRVGLGRDLGQGRSGAGARDPQGAQRLRDRPRRGRLLRPEAGFQADRRHRARMAVRHLPGRFQPARAAGCAEYVGEDGQKHRPVMLHRAILGSFERFIGILIENYAGKLPFWLAPRQVVVASIVSDADDYVAEVVPLRAKGLRAEADIRNEKINYKVREHSMGKVPVILAIGAREVAERSVSVRRLGENRTETEAGGRGARARSVRVGTPRGQCQHPAQPAHRQRKHGEDTKAEGHVHACRRGQQQNPRRDVRRPRHRAAGDRHDGRKEADEPDHPGVLRHAEQVCHLGVASGNLGIAEAEEADQHPPQPADDAQNKRRVPHACPRFRQSPAL
jgi:threonyl-tRNA synthetase